MPSIPGVKKPALGGWGDRPSAKTGAWLARDWGLAPEGIALHRPESPKIPGPVYASWARSEFAGHNALVFPASVDCVVIDVDDMKLLPRVIEACGETSYRTISGRADGGVHLWYRGATKGKNGFVPGVDIKSIGGYVIAPGSLHETTLLEYTPSPALAEALRTGRFEPPKIRDDWRVRLKSVASGITHPTRLDLQTLVDALKQNPRKREVAKRLQLVAAGREFAEPGERDAALFATLAELAHWWPNAEVEYIAALYGPSAEAVEREHEVKVPVLDALREKWSRLVAEHEEVLDLAEQRDEKLRKVAWSWVGLRRSEVARTIDGPIVAHKGRSYYLRIGEYWTDVMTREDIGPGVIASLRALYGIEVGDFAGLMAGWSQRVRDIELSFTAEHSTLDDTGLFTLATAPRRPLKPKYSETFAAGIEALAGPYAEHLRHWLGGLTRQDEPARALVLSGPRGVGKSLILAGLSRLWIAGSVPMRQVVGKQFNAMITKTPLAVADDDTAPSEQGQALSTYLRAGVSDREQHFERKHVDVQKLMGCMRFAVATNDAFELVNGAVSWRMNDESVAAFADRLLHIPVLEGAKGWWGDRASAKRLAEHEIAEHVLWLAERYTEPLDRFWSPAADRSLGVLAQLSSGLRGDVLLRVAEGAPGVEDRGDAYVVAPQAFVDGWVVDKPRGLTVRTAGLAIQALAKAVTVSQPPRVGKRKHAISKPLVAWYAQHCGL